MESAEARSSRLRVDALKAMRDFYARRGNIVEFVERKVKEFRESPAIDEDGAFHSFQALADAVFGGFGFPEEMCNAFMTALSQAFETTRGIPRIPNIPKFWEGRFIAFAVKQAAKTIAT